MPWLRTLAACAALSLLMLLAACGPEPAQPKAGDAKATPELLKQHCREAVGKPRVERISRHVWAAIGYDLANVVLIETPAGSVIVDTGMSPKRAQLIKQALQAKVRVEPVLAVIYTHSHIDHVGGATVWAGPKTQIWASAALPGHLLKQYQLFLPIESLRGRRQFGVDVPANHLPCSALGRRIDLAAAKKSGMLLPTHTFSGKKTLEFGGLKMVLMEAPGETHDQLLVWLPADRTLIAGDNFYWSFPNLYTLRGTSPRPVDGWIESLDLMRRLDPEHLVPMHTRPLHGAARVREVLTNYRDAIQWVRDATVRGANQGLDLDTLAESVKLPQHLARHHYNKELYGQVDWSVRAIYTNNLGWFDGRPEMLYPPPAGQAAAREIRMMGGPDEVLAQADKALQAGDARWAVHLLAKLRTSNLMAEDPRLNKAMAAGLRQVARGVYNTNGRGYLMQTARELEQGPPEVDKAEMNERLASGIPLEHLFKVMVTRLKPAEAMDVHQSMVFEFPDEKRRFVLTVRRGVAEAVQGRALAGTPKPVGVVSMNAGDFRRLMLGQASALGLWAKGKVSCDGSWLDVVKFLGRFDRQG